MTKKNASKNNVEEGGITMTAERPQVWDRGM